MKNPDKPMATAIAIRKAHPQDAAAIAACLASAFAPFRSQYTAGAFADTVLNAEGVLDRMAHMTIYAAVTPVGEIVGTVAAAVVDQVGHLRGMAVRPDWQGRAIAEQLLRVAENDMRTAGLSSHHAGFNAAPPASHRFYEQHGFVRSGDVSNFFGMPLHEYVKHSVLLEPTALRLSGLDEDASHYRVSRYKEAPQAELRGAPCARPFSPSPCSP